MYNSEYLNFVAKQHLPEDHHEILEKLAEIVPESGILEKPIPEIAHELGCSGDKLIEIIDLLFNVNPVLIKKEGDILIFDYEESKINYVRHLRNAMSNIGLQDL